MFLVGGAWLLGGDDDCAICMEECVGDDCVTTDCEPVSHKFHKRCIKGWLETNCVCPNCRADLREWAKMMRFRCGDGAGLPAYSHGTDGGIDQPLREDDAFMMRDYQQNLERPAPSVADYFTLDIQPNGVDDPREYSAVPLLSRTPLINGRWEMVVEPDQTVYYRSHDDQTTQWMNPIMIRGHYPEGANYRNVESHLMSNFRIDADRVPLQALTKKNTLMQAKTPANFIAIVNRFGRELSEARWFAGRKKRMLRKYLKEATERNPPLTEEEKRALAGVGAEDEHRRGGSGRRRGLAM